MARKTKAQKAQEEREAKIERSMKFLQDHKYEMFQQIPGLVDVSFVETPQPVILIKTVAAFDIETYELAQGTGIDFQVKVLEAKDDQGKPVVITDSGLKNMKLVEDESESTDGGINDFITVGVDPTGKTVMRKIPGQKDPSDITLNPEDMVFKPGENC